MCENDPRDYSKGRVNVTLLASAAEYMKALGAARDATGGDDDA
jgi:hypothetical protein